MERPCYRPNSDSKNLPSAPKTLEDAGCTGFPGGAAGVVAVGATGAGVDTTAPPWSGHNQVGAVPARNGRVIARGQAVVARPPLAGSIVAIVIPRGTGKFSGSPGAACVMNPTHAGSAASAPVNPMLRGWSNPTQTPHTRRGV